MALPTNSNAIRYVVHMADLHIRNGEMNTARFFEYNTVFQRIIAFLTDFEGINETVVVIAGDIFHNKLAIGPSGGCLFSQLIRGLANLCPVYIIRGNHDYRQDKPDEPDMISPFLTFAHDRVAYIDDVGHFVADGVGFAVMPIQLTLDSGNTSGKANVLPDFPGADQFPDHVHTKIALFHGYVTHEAESKFDSIPISWFGKGYDYIMLGDIHRQAVNGGVPMNKHITMSPKGTDVFVVASYQKESDSEAMWGYPGSTLQQTFGESLLGHGMILWDIKEKQAHMMHIKNDVAMIKMNKDDSGWRVLVSHPAHSEYMPIDVVAKNPWFPSVVYPQILGPYDCAVQQDVVDVLAKYGIVCKNTAAAFVDLDLPATTSNQGPLDVPDISCINTPETWIQYINETVTDLDYAQWRDWFTTPDSLVIKNIDMSMLGMTIDLQAKIDDRNKKIRTAIDVFHTQAQAHNSVKHMRIKLLFMNWCNVLCYKGHSFFDFEKLDGQIACVTGKNGTGKTSFLETICIAIFGTSFPSRHNKAISSSIICQQKDKLDSCNTSIVLMVDDKKYRIERTFGKQDNASKINSKLCVVEALQDNGCWSVVQKDKTAVDDWVKNNVGDINAFLLSCMITQNFDSDFFALKPQDQRARIDSALCLSSSAAFRDILHTARLGYNDIIAVLETAYACTVGHEAVSFDDTELSKAHDALELAKGNTTKTTKTICECDEQLKGIDRGVFTVGKSELARRLDSAKKRIDYIRANTSDYETLLERRASLRNSFREVEGVNDTTNLEVLRQQLASLLGQAVVAPQESLDVITAEIARLESEASRHEKNHNDTSLKRTRDAKFRELKATIALQLKAQDRQHNTVCRLADAESAHAHALKQLTEHVLLQPMAPRTDAAEYGEWNRQYSLFSSKYGSINKLQELIDACKQPKCERSTMTINEINNATQRIAKWLKQCKFDPFLKDFDTKLTTSKSRLAKIHSQVSTSDNSVANIRSRCDALEADIGGINTQIRDLMQTKPDIPKYPKKLEYNRERKKLTVLSDNVKKRSALLENYDAPKDKCILDTGMELINTLQVEKERMQCHLGMRGGCEEFPFNPDCFACKQQPWRKKVVEIDTAIRASKDAIGSIEQLMVEKYDCVIDIPRYNLTKTRYASFLELQELQKEEEKLMAFWEDYDRNAVAYTEWNDLYTNAQKKHDRAVKELKSAQTALKTTTASVKALEQEAARIKAEVDELTAICSARDSEYKPLQGAIVKNREALRAWNDWEQQHAVLTADLTSWMALDDKRSFYAEERARRAACLDFETKKRTLERDVKDSTKAVTDLKANKHVCDNEVTTLTTKCNAIDVDVKELEVRYTSLVRILEELKTWRLKRTQHHAYDSWINNIAATKRKIQYHEIKEGLDSCAFQMNLVSEARKLEEDIKEYERVLPLFDVNQTIITAQQALCVMQSQCIQLAIDVSKFENKRADAIKARQTAGAIKEYLDQASAILTTLVTIEQKFADFKNWVFETKAMPVICTNVNRLLHLMCKNHRPLFLETVFTDDGAFNWLLRDGNNAPPFEKASGFQRFMTSLAMRITLGKLGVSGMSIRQIFIDEGFTACDSENLASVPEFLQGLLESYDTVMIVSHLDELKTIGVTLRIQRDAMMSRIQYGSDKSPFISIKKRGRKAFDPVAASGSSQKK